MGLTINTLLCIALGLQWSGVGVMADQSTWVILGAWVGAHAASFAMIYTLISTGVIDVTE